MDQLPSPTRRPAVWRKALTCGFTEPQNFLGRTHAFLAKSCGRDVWLPLHL